MPVLKLTLEYDGAGFRGWARQPGARTIEGDVPGGARRRLPGLGRARGRRADGHRRPRDRPGRERRGRPAARRPSGRARRSTRRFRTMSPCWPSSRRRGLQRPLLGPLALLSLPDPPPRRPLAVRRPAGALVAAPARSRRARGGCGADPRRHDFTAFTPTETQHRLFTRTVSSAAWEDRGEELHFTIEAESFLRHMVRTLVGTMLEGPRAGAAAGRPAAQRGRHDRAAVGPLPGACGVLSRLATSNACASRSSSSTSTAP